MRSGRSSTGFAAADRVFDDAHDGGAFVGGTAKNALAP